MYFEAQIYSASEMGAKIMTENFSFGSPSDILMKIWQKS
jgi:hypothetical protein